MISSQEALEIILANALPFGEERIPFLEATGRILKESIYADRDFPPFNRVMMDGIALAYQRVADGQTQFYIENIQAAGSPQRTLENPHNAIEVMTGAILPEGTDTVIPYEKIELLDGVATLHEGKVTPNQHVHFQGTDRTKNDELIPKNTKITPVEMGLLATVGIKEVLVSKVPKTLVLSTGDELVEVDQIPAQHEIRRSNVYTLMSLLAQVHIKSDEQHLPDNKPLLKKKIKQYLNTYDCILCSGAVSKGKYDFLPEVFDELGVQQHFHKVKQRPGKPFWFGSKGSCSIFAFPGNPVSTFVGALYYFSAWYTKGLGITPKETKAVLTEDVIFKPELTYFLQVKLKSNSGSLEATPIRGNGSGDLANLALADAFLILPANQEKFNKGTLYPLVQYR
ncbi:molybdopterin molybdotransferase MoeA [Flavobacteriaceae bacterium F08102]|nr:molybdopterin molybdotransferase MoeA [Flavobacteriaceae bacterium F08102]